MNAPHRHGGSGYHTHGFRSSSRKSLWTALVLISGFMVAEIVGGLLSNSLALLADAAHMVTDAAAIALALLAIWISTRPESIHRTFGFHRTEIIAALLNALSLWLIAGWIFFEAYRRFLEPPDVQGVWVLIVGGLGLVVNLMAAYVLQRSSGESLNVEGAFLHVLGDLLGSIAVVISGALIIVFGWTIADPVFSVLIGLFLIVTSGRLLWKVVHVLMEGTPSRLDLNDLCSNMERVSGVTGVHDIHAWTITTGYDVLSAHVTTDHTRPGEQRRVLRELRSVATRDFGISHVTIQLEDSPAACMEGHHIDHDSENDDFLESESQQSRS
jgi:cobalt-zinc-cadmium efflux system protein